MVFSDLDQQMMARALSLAEKGLYSTMPNPRVGCVITRGEKIIGEGWHEKAGDAHAEIHALRAATESTKGATLYVSLEPCCHTGRTPPCTDALIAAGVSRVVVAMNDPDPRVAGKGTATLIAAGICVESGLMAEKAALLNVGFISRITRQRPWLRLKAAASLDGKTALENGQSQWMTGEAARADGQLFRARACAVLTGIGTVLADDPQMNVRLSGFSRQPRRIVVDSHWRTPPTARILQGGNTLLVGISPAADDGAGQKRLETLQAAGAETLCQPDHGGRVDLNALLCFLATKGINEVHVEAGATMNGALLAAGLVDELLLYIAPCLIGHPARSLFEGTAITNLSEKILLDVASIEAIGKDWRVLANLVSSPSLSSASATL